MTETEVICRAICQSGKFEIGEGTCALICMDQLGDPRKMGCRHAGIHSPLADKIIEALKKYHDFEDQVNPN